MLLLPEQRIILAALLLAVAEQDIKFVRVKTREPARTFRVKSRLSEAAKEFVWSEEFEDMASEINMNADRLRVYPEKAYRAYQKLISDSGEFESELS